MLHIPLLRRGTAYRSLDVATAPHHATGQPFVEISQANVGLIRRDLLQQDAMRASLLRIPAARLIEMTRAAAPIFLNDTLPIGDDAQTPDDYVRQVSATTGMPYAMVRRNMQRVASVMENVGDIVRGLTRGLDLAVLDRGYSDVNGQAGELLSRTQALGVVLPSNSPGVHGLWIPAIAMKMPLVLRPGSAEPWTPYRIIQALMKAGVPGDAFNYFPERPRRRRRDRAADAGAACSSATSARRRVCRRSAHRAARPGLQQGRARRRPRAATGATRSI